MILFCRWLFTASLLFCTVRVLKAQPTELILDLEGETLGEQIIAIQVPEFSHRSFNFVPGRSYNVSCTAPSGFAAQSAIWYKVHSNGSLIGITRVKPTTASETKAYVFKPDPTLEKFTIRFQNFSESQNGRYVCVSPDSNKTLLISNSNPSVISSRYKLVVTDGEVSSNEATQRIFVSGDPSPSASLISWKHNGQPLNASNNLGIMFFSSRELHFPNFQFKHEGNYTATVTNMYGNSSDNFYLDVQSGPRLVLTVSSSQPLLGDTVILTCTDSRGDPLPEFTWTYNDQPLPTDNGYTTQLTPALKASVGVLTISQVNFSHIGSYKCRANNSASYDTETEDIQVLFPSPTVPTVSLSSSNSIKFSGGRVNFTCQTILSSSPHYNGPLTANITWKRNGSPISNESNRLSISVANNGLSYTSVLSILALSKSIDSGNYSCEVRTTANDGQYTSDTLISANTVLNVQVPPHYLSITPLTEKVPNFAPYNQLSLSCSITIPSEHYIIPHFYWYTSNQLLIHGQQGYSIINGSSNSTLSFVAVTPGVAKYTCQAVLVLPGSDPNITLNGNSTITVRGPVPPNLPTRITIGNVDYNSARIQWTVPSIAYTPENYFIRYGTSENDRNLVSESVKGSSSLNANEETLSITLQYLEHDQEYFYTLVANNSHGQTTSIVQSFKTQKLALIQFMAGPFRGCHNGRVLDSSAVDDFMKTQIAAAVTSSCSCSFPPTNLINGSVLCTATNSDQLLFRVFVVSTNELTSAAIVNHVTQWVRNGPEVTSGVAKVTFSSSCPTNISTLQDPICTNNLETEPTPTTGGLNDDSFGSNTDILIAVVAGALILLEGVIIVILFCALCHQNSKIRILLKKRSHYGNVRRSSSIAASEGPSDKWKGDAYVTTECPAYLSAYKPKELEDFEDDLAIPAIYDTIDHHNGRGLPAHLQRPPPLPPTGPNGILPQQDIIVSTSGNTSSDDENTGSSMMS